MDKRVRKIILIWFEVGNKRLWRKKKEMKTTVILTYEIVKQAMYGR